MSVFMFDGSILHDLFSGRIFCLFLERNCNFGNGAEELCYSFNSYNSFHSLRYEITLHKSNLLFFLPFLLTTTNFLRFLIPVVLMGRNISSHCAFIFHPRAIELQWRSKQQEPIESYWSRYTPGIQWSLTARAQGVCFCLLLATRVKGNWAFSWRRPPFLWLAKAWSSQGLLFLARFRLAFMRGESK